jgi:predicted ATPase/DNA-binding NarL/FixJ family response regulator
MGGMGTDQAARAHGFVTALTSFVGRQDEVDEVASLLADYRLVTVTGPGGMGKTRLAHEVARLVAAKFADGARLVELAAVQDPGQVPAAVVARLGVPGTTGRSPAETLTAVLGRQQVLLVLDNCEHLIGAVAELCGNLLPVADDVRVLATSRERIGLAGEARFRLLPLPVRATDVSPDVPPDTAPEGEVPAAIRLFSDRARQADPRFILDGVSLPLAARLVERLDGMPLAIELAAARVEALGLAQLVDRLEASLPLLVSPDRTAAARHRSLAATVDWSYRLLDEQEQRVFRRLAVFPGPFTLDAAATVAGVGAEPVVLHLVDCSLLSPPQPGPDGRTRYLLPETIRMFAADRLAEAVERHEAAAALARHAIAVAEQAAADMRNRRDRAALRWLHAEEATLDQAVNWALEHDPGTALRLTTALAKWWLRRGRRAESRTMLLAAAGHAAPGSREWCLAQFWLGDIGPPEQSIGHETAALEVLTAQDPSPLLAEVLAGRSRTLMFLGRVPEAIEDARQALAVAGRIGYPAGEILALAQLSRTSRSVGDVAAALDWARRAERILASGEHRWTLEFTGHFVAEALIESGELSAARQGLEDDLAWFREVSDRIGEASVLALLADLHLRAGNSADSARQLRQAAAIAAEIGWRERLLRCLDLWAHAFAAMGQRAEAVALWTAYQALMEATGIHDQPMHARRREKPLRRAIQTLGPADARAAQERGAGMSLEAAVEFAAMTAEPGGPAAPMAPTPLVQLSTREQELVSLVAKGRTDAQIASQLYISVSTVRSHLDRIRDKTSCRRRADLTRLALQVGLA